jgi:hypothetical protein
VNFILLFCWLGRSFFTDKPIFLRADFTVKSGVSLSGGTISCLGMSAVSIADVVSVLRIFGFYPLKKIGVGKAQKKS